MTRNGCLLLAGASLLFAVIGGCSRTPRAAEKPAAAQAAPARQGLEGFWEGTLKAGAIPLRLAFKLRQGEEGKLTGTFDSIDQGAKEIPLSDVSLSDREVRIQVNAIFGVYEGKLSEDGASIVGEWKQGGASLPLTMKRVANLAELRRPQEPKPPFPYAEQQVTYENREGGSKLAGTLTLPRSGGPFPAVLLITGTGQQDRDEAIMGHRPFRVLADYLTRRGIAVLRVDDRGVGGLAGDVMRATIADLAGDVQAGVSYLKGHKEIDPKKIGLIGHSEGGTIAPMVATRSGDVSFIVLMAGTGLPGEVILYRQSALIMKANGATPAMIAQNQQAQRQMFAILKREKDPARAEKQIRAIAARLEAPPRPDPNKTAATAKEEPSAGSTKAPPEAAIQTMLSPWFRHFLTYDPRPTLRRVNVPVLAINGEKDLQIRAKENLHAIREALRSGGNRDVTVREFPGLNHLFQSSKTGSPAEYGQIEETFSPVALQVIGDWIVARTQKR